MTKKRWQLKCAVASLLCMIPVATFADWQVVNHLDTDSKAQTTVAYTKNPDGYALEIYRDSVGTVRSRFSIEERLIMLAERSCPTYQVDRGMPINRSINQAPCLAGGQWAEFILGYMTANAIRSPHLLAIMNGINIHVRFKTVNGDYRQTSFSLRGSKRALTAVLGENISITSQ